MTGTLHIKHIFRAAAAVLIAVCLQGCNQDRFIDEFLKEAPKIELSHGESASVHFENGQWKILQVTTADTYLEFSGDIYDLEGNLLREDTRYVSDMDGLFKFVHHQSNMIFSITRSAKDRLIIALEESVRDEPVCIEVLVGNEWAQKRIQAILNPCRKYVIEKVEYDFTKLDYYNNAMELKSKDTYRNTGDTPLTVILMPYQDIYREIKLLELEDLNRPNTAVFDSDLLPIFGKGRPTFEIPDIIDGKPVMKGTIVPFSANVCHLPTGLPEDKQVKVEIPAFSHMEVSCFLEMQQYDIPVKIKAVNPDTGNRINYSARLSVEQPFNHWIWTRPIKEEVPHE